MAGDIVRPRKAGAGRTPAWTEQHFNFTKVDEEDRTICKFCIKVYGSSFNPIRQGRHLR